LEYLWQNRRCLTVIATPSLGRVLMLEIGATNVGSITQTYAADTAVCKGVEKGYFAFGGSSTLLLFEPGRVELAADLVEATRQRRELYAHIGDRLGTVR
jgi:phosphatidylserine decarboxylase